MVLPQSPQELISQDTQAVLLLCGLFTAEAAQTTKPLSPAEYHGLAVWLHRLGGRPEDLLRSPEGFALSGEPGLPEPARVWALLCRGVQLARAVECWQSLGLWVISRADSQYPGRLRNLGPAAPPLLYGAGDVTRLTRGGLAVVGSRDTDEEGLSFTRQVAERCAVENVQIVSGGARGVDQEAAAAALCAGGGVVVVLAERLDRAATSRDARELLREGCLTLITPYAPNAGFNVGNAMGRNKLIYALADFGLVVRFTVGKGGTWEGANEQLRRNKSSRASVPVFVRLARNPEDGCRELQGGGAVPFPEEELSKGTILELLRRTASVSDASQAPPAQDSRIAQPASKEEPPLLNPEGDAA
jgi:predicted Rossmann fold nucleotide-binding protein DprA/Smf involved in DNA uptake